MVQKGHTVSRSGGAVTELLRRAQAGDAQAHYDAYAALHRSLRALATSQLRRHPQRSIWQPTAVVDDAWLRLLGNGKTPWADRGRFLRAAAEIMHQVVTDWARREMALKRGGRWPRADVAMDALVDRQNVSPAEILDLNAALTRLAAIRPRLAEIVHLRYFGGCTVDETATALELGRSTVEGEWQLARTLLHEMLER